MTQQLGASDAALRAKAACTLRERDGDAAAATDALVALLADDTPVDAALCGERWGRGLRPVPTSPGEQAAAALVAIGTRAFEPLLRTMTHTAAPARRHAAWGLGALDDSRAVPALVAALSDEDAGVREQVAWALGAIGDRGAVPGLIKALGDSAPRVREQAAWALGAIGDDRAIDALLPMLKDTDVKVRRQAAWAIGAIGG